MPHAVTIASPGLQALILCGPGSSFPTFTANPDENPKALLPIANRPMVWYPLEFCYRAGIIDITLVCPPSAANAISTALNTNPFLTSLPYPRPDLLSPKDLDQNTGTAEILRLPELQAVVKTDFVVLPCDLVCELGPDKLLQAWMVKSASLGDLVGDTRSPNTQRSGGLGVWYQTKTATPIKGEETDFVATVPLPSSTVLPPKGSLFPHLSKVVYSIPTDSLKDLIEEKKGFPVRHGLFRSHPRARVLTTHRDAHIYIFPRWVMELVRDNELLETIGEDIIGWWVKAGWQKGLLHKLHLDQILAKNGPSTGEKQKPDLKDSGILSPKSGQSQTTSSSVKDEGDNGAQGQEEPTIPPMLAYIHPSEASSQLIRRVDTSQLLLQISLQLAKLPSVEEVGADAASPFAHSRKVAYPEGVKPRTTITKADSLVADNVTVQEKTSIKECVVGANCQINEGARISQCLLMDGVVVGKNCRLTKCILGKRSEIGEGCVLTDCEIQENMLVEPKTEAKEEKFMSSSGLEATEQELDNFADEDGTDSDDSS
ncbi:nucleotide-diphospho-sugar transferase [Lasiosphaeria miniovina]|uniref:Translation initiation factor eIF2B subunit gamma n=1 Tax=Lasiosphaeria miniovina TaxID=1954250 RepID=A0AA39ZZY0_9PEZI|nr:nucleotide-diphospho-sugar transferase [Lasiosphaeria miniovina]KAK0706763.1 nucleotide-diphospho-sugar transferase [Lasiosphaeria miniovina]